MRQNEKSSLRSEELRALNEETGQSNEVYTVQKSSSKTLTEYALVPAAFLVQFVILGFLNNIGTIKAHWDNSPIKKGILLEQTGSVNFGSLYLSAFLGFYAIEYIGPAASYSFGSILTSVSLIVISNYPNQWTIFIFYGIFLGTGVSLILFSILCVVKEVHQDNLSAVNGIIASGTCLGTLVQAVFFDHICRRHGWTLVFRCYSVIVLVLLLMGLLIHNVYSPQNKKKVLETSFHRTSQLAVFGSVIKNAKFVILCISCFIFCLGYLTIYLYIQIYAQSRGVEAQHSRMLIGYFSLGSLFGRLLFGFCANYIGLKRVKALTVNFLVMGILNFLSAFCSSFPTFLAYCVLFGVFDGGVTALTFPVICDMFARSEKGTVLDNEVQIIDRGKQENMAIALSYVTQGISLIIGPLITNMLVGTGGDVSTGFIFSALMLTTASFILATMHFV